MIFQIQMDKDREEQIIAIVHRRTPLIDEIEKLVLQDSVTDQIPGYDADEITMLKLNEVECFFTESEKTFAVCSDGKRYQVKKKLYELEGLLPKQFERISKSAIANWETVAKFKVQLSGAVDVVFKSGYADCISRRCFADLKRRYKL